MSIKRWWRGHGFGVHSPFAFRFITEVLRCDSGYAYYAYDELKRQWMSAPSGERMSWRRMAAIYRVGVRFAPAPVALRGDDPYGLASAAIAMASGSADIPAEDTVVSVWADITTGGWPEAVSAMKRGMSFSDGHIGIIVADCKLPLHHYEVKL